ncbi:MAG TPA: hypothetical protein VF544_12590 [Pyrinomonadaceae bacterium]|jgi:hypothetical protein
MNCSDFESIINDLARAPLQDASERAEALAHAEGCQRCSVRLAEERALTSGLRTLAARAAQAQAPARVEAALLSAFRQRDNLILLKPAPEQPRRARNMRWAHAGIAAAVALLFIFAALFYVQRPERQQELATARDSHPARLVLWNTDTNGDTNQRAGRRVEAVAAPAERDFSPQLAFERVSNRTRDRFEAPGRRLPQPEGPQAVNAAAVSTGEDIATDFIPLNYGADLSNLDSGRVVRVELPRTALARYGLPMNAERAGEPVKADVLLGEDGLARAIRFVR